MVGRPQRASQPHLDEPDAKPAWYARPFISSASTSLDDKGKKQQDDDQKATSSEKYWKVQAGRLQVDKDLLGRKHDDLKRNNDDLKRNNDGWVRAYNATVRDLEEQKIAHDCLEKKYIKLQSDKDDLEQELQGEKSLIEELRQNIEKEERVVAKAHQNAISLLARDVSSDFPDDQVKAGFKDLFDRCSEWCYYNRAEAIRNVEEVRGFLLTSGIVDDSGFPEHLRFNMMHNTATSVLLQALLAKTLCGTFLKDPFFLGGLGRQERLVSKSALTEG